tara:strand:+ start:1160 stop:1402 length:243 start_codon:yes stop_codon:yes gene_type:complete
MNRRNTIDGVVSYIDISWREVKSHRDMELSKSDWRASSDLVLSEEWKEFRQFLRNLPQNYETANEAADAFTEYEKPDGWM